MVTFITYYNNELIYSNKITFKSISNFTIVKINHYLYLQYRLNLIIFEIISDTSILIKTKSRSYACLYIFLWHCLIISLQAFQPVQWHGIIYSESIFNSSVIVKGIVSSYSSPDK